MNIPAIISKNTLAPLGKADTHAVRVILHDVHNPSPSRIRCRNRQYLFERDGVLMAHALDIPMSVWMEGVGKGRFRDNRAVCDDFREVKQKFTVQIVEINAPTASGNVLPELRRLLTALNAPDDVERAFAMIDAGANAEELSAYVDRIISKLDSEPTIESIITQHHAEEQAKLDAANAKTADPEVAETPAQAKARKMREAKAAKKAQLQPA